MASRDEELLDQIEHALKEGKLKAKGKLYQKFVRSPAKLDPSYGLCIDDAAREAYRLRWLSALADETKKS